MRFALGLPLAFCALPALAWAQDGRPCELQLTGVRRAGVLTTYTNVFTDANGARTTYFGGGVDATCRGQGNRLQADSAEHFESRGELILVNRVRYNEPRMSLQSERMIYFTNDDRLIATGSVRGRSSSGTRFSGPQIEYFRAKPGVRSSPSWRAPGRPSVRMAPQDTTAPRASARVANDTRGDSTDLTANYIVSVNDSLVSAVGQVVIERHDLKATADSATLDQGTGFARLMREPRIEGRGERAYTLTGVRIDLWSTDQRLERVLSVGDARIDGDSITLTGDTIDLRLKDQRMERVYAWGKRPRATATAQEMEADSLDVLLPSQRLQEVHAIGTAVARSSVDTARIVSEEKDWITGDTLIALFDTLATSDTTQGSRMREVVATGNARAFYQLPPPAGARGLPNLTYNRGRAITVTFADGAVKNVAVREKASGIYLEAAPADTVKPAATPLARRP